MSRTEPNVYESCDAAIRAMNRENVEAFGRLKMADWDRVNVIRTVVAVYQESADKARKRYRKVAYDAYLMGLWMCGILPSEARIMADKAITEAWVDDILSRTDPVTLYRFDTETERKAYRLAETLEVAQDRNREIDRALRVWSRQLGQYAINFTDDAMVQAFQDAGVEEVRWVTQKDERVCAECNGRDEETFRLGEIPPKHWGCRCYVVPVIG